RSRTGCRTCRARRIKCDETPVACRNCSSTGRQCDGYDVHRLPPKLKSTGKKKTLTAPPKLLGLAGGPSQALNRLDWTMTSDERRCVAYFQHHTVPTLLEFFDSTLWQKLVLQLSRSEPPVYHAIVALSAIHENSEANGMPLATPSELVAENPWHQFAQDQLARAITLLNRRSASQDPRFREVILVCCLLFVLADLLRGQYDSGFAHLRSGLLILQELQQHGEFGNCASSRGLVEQCIVTAFAHLDILASHYDRIFPMLQPLHPLTQPSNHDPTTTTTTTTTNPNSPTQPFQSLPEARAAFDTLLRTSYRFSAPSMGLTAPQISANYAALQTEQHAVWSEATLFAQRFRPLYRHAYPDLSAKEQRGADIINLHLVSLRVCMHSCLLGSNRAALAHYRADLQHTCELVEALMTTFPDHRPSFTLETGVLPPLYLAAILGDDYRVRWRATGLMRSWPHREGPFDSNWLASLAEEALLLDL
ncbi:Zn(II)2Cys6 transcription factor, partial [Aspergillus brunneoviolaceus CBS 621.78]